MPFALATFNVKNLLEPRDERERATLKEKLDAIATQIRACDADVVGLQEVGPIDLVRAVADRVKGRPYGDPIIGTPDARGIRCALLARIPVVYARIVTADALSFPVFRACDPEPFGARIPLRRGVVHARVDASDLGPVDVLVVHFKSSLPVGLRDASGAELPPVTPRDRAAGMLRSLVWRGAEALHARKLVDDVLAVDPSARVAVVGDLNDRPSSLVVRALRSEGEGELFDCAARVEAAARFSVLHHGSPAQIDHALVTANLYARLAHARFLNAALRDHGAFDPAEPISVDSDHAPLVVRFE